MKNETEVKSILMRAAAHTLEGLCFLDVVREGAEHPDAWEVESEVRFREAEGARHGAVALRLAGISAAELATAMLGDGVDGEALALDALGEITNVMCGSVLTELLGAGAVFDLQHPQVRRVTSAEPSHGTRVLVGVESGVAELVLALDGSPP